jgi:hypothetical protein
MADDIVKSSNDQPQSNCADHSESADPSTAPPSDGVRTKPTPRQIAANRRNAKLSTGPRTPEGKERTKFNAFKTGISRRGSQGLLYELPRAYARLHANLVKALRPEDALDELDVREIAMCYLRLKRVAEADEAQGVLAQRDAILQPFKGGGTYSAHEGAIAREEEIDRLQGELTLLEEIISQWNEATPLSDEVWSRLEGLTLAELLAGCEEQSPTEQLERLIFVKEQTRCTLDAYAGNEPSVVTQARAAVGRTDISRHRNDAYHHLQQLLNRLERRQQQRRRNPENYFPGLPGDSALDGEITI